MGAVISTLLALFGLLGIAQVFLRWKAYRFAELRSVLAEIETVLEGDRKFLSEGAKKAERDLDVLADELHARTVTEPAHRTLEHRKKAFASEPGPSFFVLGAPETQADRDRAARSALHQEHIRECLAASRSTKRAMNRIERWTYPPLR